VSWRNTAQVTLQPIIEGSTGHFLIDGALGLLPSVQSPTPLGSPPIPSPPLSFALPSAPSSLLTCACGLPGSCGHELLLARKMISWPEYFSQWLPLYGRPNVLWLRRRCACAPPQTSVDDARSARRDRRSWAGDPAAATKWQKLRSRAPEARKWLDQSGYARPATGEACR
jgi:hypothetical protein